MWISQVITLALLFPIMRAMSDTGVPERFINLVLGSAKGTCDLILRPLLLLLIHFL